jgi:hypothetical protein
LLIAATSGDSQKPYENLMPLMDALVASGSKPLDNGFRLSRAGWNCRLADPIDFQLLRDQFEIPASIVLSEEHDAILDRNSWCSIEGPGADLARRRASGGFQGTGQW